MINGNRTCRSIKDVKSICPACNEKNFASYRSSVVQDRKEEKEILSLLCWNCRRAIEIDFKENKEWYGHVPGEPYPENINELIYLPYNGEDMKKLQDKYPEATFSDASDYIHPERFTIDLKTDKKCFYKTLIQLGISECCLGFRLCIGGLNKNSLKIIKDIMEELKAEHDPCIKEEYWT